VTLIKSISGIRGTIGGKVNEALTPIDAVKFASAYGTWLIENNSDSKNLKVVIGRDARISGNMISNLVSNALIGLGIHVIDTQLSTTPTVEMAVVFEKAHGGIILTASHNPKQWNALKLLNHKGEFISAKQGERILEIAQTEQFSFAEVDNLGSISYNDTFIEKHIDAILALNTVNKKAIAEKKFKVVIDCVNSSGGIVLPQLLKALGVAEVVEMYCTPNGVFPHNPEPLPEHLTEISKAVVAHKAHLGIVVDPDVDRLALINEDGTMFGEEYTLVAVADYILKYQKGNTVSNLSSTRALRDVTQAHGHKYFASAVGEVNVVEMMKKENAVIGGEGNGGIIYPTLHYGRDAMVGIALFLSHLAEKNMTMSQLKNSYPSYFISKNKIELTAQINTDSLLEKMVDKYSSFDINTIDGVKINFEAEWVHLRKSNTEPIIRIYSESKDKHSADKLSEKIIEEIKSFI
jgi:phosphomannomutase